MAPAERRENHQARVLGSDGGKFKNARQCYAQRRFRRVGHFCGSIALPGVRQVMLFFGAGWWNLNKILSISFEKLCIGPIVPALCIEAGYFMRYGRFLTEFNLTTLGRQFLQRVWEWVLGSLVVAPLLAAAAFIIVWLAGFMLHRSLRGRV